MPETPHGAHTIANSPFPIANCALAFGAHGLVNARRMVGTRTGKQSISQFIDYTLFAAQAVYGFRYGGSGMENQNVAWPGDFRLD